MKKLPAIQFYPGDWHRDPGVQLLTFEERGVWIEMLFRMHDSEEYGALVINGRALTDDEVGRLIGYIHEDSSKLYQVLANLLSKNVATRRQNDGAICCRRMLRNKDIIDKRADNGRLGGLAKSLAKKLAKASPSSSSSSSSSSSEDKSKIIAPTVQKPSGALTDELWIQSFKTNPLYSGIDVDLQLKRAQSWLQTNAPRRQFTRKYFGNWMTGEICKKPMFAASLGKPCQSRVKRGLEFVPCNKPATAMIGTRPVCPEHNVIKEPA